jgi:hypothetical protein
VVGIVKKPCKKSYDSSRKFKTKWVAKLPWAKRLMAIGGIIQTVRCRACSLIDNKDEIVECK